MQQKEKNEQIQVNKLPENISSSLANQKETSMGVQICNVKLADGRKFANVVIANGEFVIGIRMQASVPFEAKDVVEATVQE